MKASLTFIARGRTELNAIQCDVTNWPLHIQVGHGFIFPRLFGEHQPARVSNYCWASQGFGADSDVCMTCEIDVALHEHLVSNPATDSEPSYHRLKDQVWGR